MPNQQTTLPSPDEVEAARTPAGGWTKDTLAQWGIPWPPPKGWRERLRREWEAKTTHRDRFFAELAWAEDHLIYTPDQMRQRLVNQLAEADPRDEHGIGVLIERAKEMARDVR